VGKIKLYFIHRNWPLDSRNPTRHIQSDITAVSTDICKDSCRIKSGTSPPLYPTIVHQNSWRITRRRAQQSERHLKFFDLNLREVISSKF